MLMVIFGAGASFDSSPTYTPGMVPPGATPTDQHNDFNRPPLAKDLFANRPLFIDALEAFPQCKTIVHRLRAPAVISGQMSIETLLQEIEEEAKTYARGPQELAAVRCYLQRAISQCEMNWRNTTRGITNYLALLREIERTHRGDEPVCLVTFNYDTLLEAALEQLGLMVRSMEDYIDRLALFRVFKLHGSINWAQEVFIQLPGNIHLDHPPLVLRHLIENAAGLPISNRFVLCDPGSMGVANGRPVFPAIAIPLEKKQGFQCPQDMVDRLTAVLPHVTKILVIGWRASEARFLDLLKRHLNRGVYLCVVAGNQAEAEKIKVRIHEVLLNNPPSSTSDHTGFTEFIRSRRAEGILSS
jgi:SIR2-like domain